MVDSWKSGWACGAAVALSAAAQPAMAQQRSFDVPSQPISTAITQFARQAGIQIVAPADGVSGVRSNRVKGTMDVRKGLLGLIDGSGLVIAADQGGVILLKMQRASAPVSAVRPPEPEIAAEPVGGLEEIVVTAQRRKENLQRAAIAVDVVTGSALVNNAITQPAQLGALVPALSVQTGGGTQTILFIRGIGTFATNAFSDTAVAVNFDGIYVSRNSALSGLMYDLERVEVLKGPQGTLYGRNATAGAINFLPVKPQLGRTSGNITASYGNYDAVAVQGAINLALGDTAAFRLSGNVARHDGYLSDGTQDEDIKSVRAQLLTELTPDLTVRIAGDYFHVGGRGPGATYGSRYSYDPAANRYNFLPAGFDRSVGLFDPASEAYRRTIFSPLAGRTFSNYSETTYQDNDFYGFNAEIEYVAPIGTFTLIPGFRESKIDNVFGVPGFLFDAKESVSQTSVEARWASNRISIFNAIIGVYYFDEEIDASYTINQQVFGNYQDQLNKTKSYAAFGRVTAHLSDRLRLVGGLRYTSERKSTKAQGDAITLVCTVRVAGVASCPTVPLLPLTLTLNVLPFTVPAINGPPAAIGTTGAIATRATTIVNARLKNSRATYRAAFEFDIGPRSLLYASFETGFRSGGFSLAAGKEVYQPESIDAFTLGSKNRLFDGRLQLNVEGFYWKYRDQQIAHTGPDLRGNNANFTENVGSSTSKGVEVEASFLATPNTLLSAQVQYLDAVYDSYVYQVLLGTAPPAVGCPTRPNATNPTLRDVDCSGFPAYNAPKWTMNVRAQQTVPIGDYKLVFSADTQFKTSRFISFEYLEAQRVGHTWQSNASVTLSPVDAGWSLSAYVRNIEGDRIATTAPIFNFGSTIMTMGGPPRIFGIRVSAEF